ncbi:MAG: AbgT family transporter [Bacilli bacterium]
MNNEGKEELVFEEKRKIKIHPTIIFILISMLIVLLSGIAELFNLSITYNEINPLSGKVEPTLVTVNSLLSFDGFRYIIGNALKNFVNFTPLSMTLLALLGIGVAEKSGYLKTLLTKIVKRIPYQYITFLIIFLGICTSLATEVGYVILLPLAALLFLINGRHPIAGIVTGFAGVTIGYGINFFIGPTDQILSTYTTNAANIIDSGYEATMAGNWYFMIIATIIMSFIGMLITEKIIVPKLGKYKDNEDFKKIEITNTEKKGLRYARIATIVLGLIFLYMIIPGLPASGLLLDNTEITYVNKLFGYNSYFSSGIIFIISLIFLVGGISYGIGTKKIKNDKDVANIMTSALDKIGIYIVFIFFASQLIAYLNYTNLGTILVAGITKLVKNLSFTGVPLILLLLLITMIVNLLVNSTTLKWSIMAPIFIPMFMQANLSPEFTQLIFRAGDSITKPLTIFLPYFIIFLVLIYKYNKTNSVTTIKKSISLMLPYSLILGLIWIALIIGWYIIGLPIGPEVYPTI